MKRESVKLRPNAWVVRRAWHWVPGLPLWEWHARPGVNHPVGGRIFGRNRAIRMATFVAGSNK